MPPKRGADGLHQRLPVSRLCHVGRHALHVPPLRPAVLQQLVQVGGGAGARVHAGPQPCKLLHYRPADAVCAAGHQARAACGAEG